MRHRHSRKLIPAAAVAAALLVPSACGGDDPEPKAQETVTVTAAPEKTSEAPDAEGTSDASESAEPTSDSAPTAPTEFGRYTSPSATGVTVVDSGYTGREGLDNPFFSYGAVLYNNGPATSVDVTTQGIHNDQVIDRAQETFSYVPANSFFVVGGTLVEMKSRSDTVEFTVSTSETSLPSIDVAIAADATIGGSPGSYGPVSLRIANSGADTLPEGAVHVVLLDASGKIVGGDNNFLSVPVPGGGQKVRDVVDDVYIPVGAKTALAYVDLLYAL